MDGALSNDPSIPHPVETIDDASQKKQSLGWSGLRKHTVTPFVLPPTSYVAKGEKARYAWQVPVCTGHVLLPLSITRYLQYLYWVVYLPIITVPYM